MRRRAAVLVALLVACSDQHPLGPASASLSRRAPEAGTAASEPLGVTTLTWNVYVGADIERVVRARTAEEAIALATEEWAHVRATNFPARASALAQAIAAQRPQLVGLEELAIYRTTDRPFEELATIGGQTYRFVATHLAGQEVQVIQLAQTRELLALLGTDARPTILVGDFNSDAFGADPTRATATYGLLRAAGFRDAWVNPDRRAPGLTCCEQADLLNPRPTFDQRIDFIFGRDLPAGAVPIRREVVGDRPGDRTGAGLWPSDHAGVVVTFMARPAGRETVAITN